MPDISIIGCGALGWGFGGHLQLRGHKVRLWAHPDHRTVFHKISRGGDFLQLKGEVNGQFRPELDKDIGRCVRHSEFLVITVPSNGHDNILTRLVDYDLSEKTIIAMPGNGFTFAARRILQPRYFPKAVLETTTSPYAVRMVNTNITILGIKNKIEIAASIDLPPARKDEIAALFPQTLAWYDSLVAIFISNINAVGHPPALLAAKEDILAGNDLLFYRECLPRAINEVLAVDQERLCIAAALGVQTDSDLGFLLGWYGGGAATLEEFYRTYHGYGTIKAPKTLHHRYLTEDVADGLVLMRSVAVKWSVATPAIDEVIKKAGNALGRDLFREGKTLEKVGLGDASQDQILRALNDWQPLGDPYRNV